MAMLVLLNVDIIITSYSFLFKRTKTPIVFEIKSMMRQNLNPCCLLFAHSQLGAPVGLKQKSNACHLILNFDLSTGIQGGG